MTLFKLGTFTLHSGDRSNWKIDCDALVDNDYRALAFMIKERFQFGAVFGIPENGTILAHHLARYVTEGPTLIVDDVLTTGTSMEHMKKNIHIMQGEDVIGVVIFSRGKCPDWVVPLFQYSW